MKYLKYFPTEAEYNAFIQSEDFILPNVSYAVDADSVFYNIVKTESGDYKVILLEKKDISGLTYNTVDLGLPSGLLWADRNIGASSPEDFGTYFAWGEKEGYSASSSITYCTAEELCAYLQPMIGDEMELTPDNIDLLLTDMGVSEKDISAAGVGFATDKCFSWDFSDYFDTTDGGETFNKYATDKLTVIQPEDDAATVYMGSEYRMPTWSEIQELIDNTTPIFIDLQGNEFSTEEAENEAIANFNFKGVRLIGSNGNSIFIPAAGRCQESTRNCGFSEVYLIPSNLRNGSNTHTYKIMFDFYGGIGVSTDQRSSGNIIRGVKKEIITFNIDDISYNAYKGMTWGEWVNSSYNTDNYINAGTYIGKDNEYGSIKKSNIAVLPTDTITVDTYDWVVGGAYVPGTNVPEDF